MTNLDERIDSLLAMPPYGLNQAERQNLLLEILQEQVLRAAATSEAYGNYVKHWPVPVAEAATIADLPYLPVSVFKRNPPLALLPTDKFQRVLLSSATTGQEPSRIAVDSVTAKRMTKGVVAILRDFIGAERRPYLVVDCAETNADAASLGARGAAIRGLAPFATETVYCLTSNADGELVIDHAKLNDFSARHADRPVLVYGFTSILWTRLVKSLAAAGKTLGMKNIHILHSGGWKKLVAEAVSKEAFTEATAAVFGCSPERVIDYYGMVENLGIIYPDCPFGNKHAPVFGEAIIRDPLTLRPAAVGQTGMVQVCSALPTSFPGHLLLTEDMATVVAEDDCPCGRPGIAFRFVGRVPKAETRGCGNVDTKRKG